MSSACKCNCREEGNVNRIEEEQRIYPRTLPSLVGLKRQITQILHSKGIHHFKLYIVGGYATGLGRHSEGYDIDVAVVLTKPTALKELGVSPFGDIGEYGSIPIEAHFYPGYRYRTPLECLKEFEGPFDETCKYVEL